MKLNKGFEVIRGGILVINSLSSISQAYKLIMREEKHKKLIQEDAMTFATNRRSYQDKSKSEYDSFQFRKKFLIK